MIDVEDSKCIVNYLFWLLSRNTGEKYSFGSKWNFKIWLLNGLWFHFAIELQSAFFCSFEQMDSFISYEYSFGNEICFCGDTQNLPGCHTVQCAVGNPAWQEGWTRWSSKVSSNLGHSVMHIACMYYFSFSFVERIQRSMCHFLIYSDASCSDFILLRVVMFKASCNLVKIMILLYGMFFVYNTLMTFSVEFLYYV